MKFSEKFTSGGDKKIPKKFLVNFEYTICSVSSGKNSITRELLALQFG